MRTFIAIGIPDEVKAMLIEAQRSLKNSGAVDASWPRPEGIHLTLKFLGEVSESKIPDISNGLRHAVKGNGPFRLELGSIGTFPNSKKTRVVWVGLSGEVEKLSRLQATVEDAMTGIGFERDERSFTPHLTLGRIKFIRSRDGWIKALAEAKDIRPSGFDVVAIYLMKSELTPSGALYTEIRKIDLT